MGFQLSHKITKLHSDFCDKSRPPSWKNLSKLFFNFGVNVGRLAHPVPPGATWHPFKLLLVVVKPWTDILLLLNSDLIVNGASHQPDEEVVTLEGDTIEIQMTITNNSGKNPSSLLF
jgi:hypothetical protein